jgi:hypothetical protein
MLVSLWCGLLVPCPAAKIEGRLLLPACDFVFHILHQRSECAHALLTRYEHTEEDVMDKTCSMCGSIEKYNILV